jgi:hypothetical protein
MNKLKNISQSIDIYFNDLVPEFVVKIHNNLDKMPPTYFRNLKLKTAIEEACNYLLNESQK